MENNICLIIKKVPVRKLYLYHYKKVPIVKLYLSYYKKYLL